MSVEQIDGFIEDLIGRCENLNDCLEWPETADKEERDGGEEELSDETPVFPSSSGVSIKGVGQGAFNAFPSRQKGSCCPAFLLVLPREPRNPSLGVVENAAWKILYFIEACVTVRRWIRVCRGRDLVVLTDTWPLPSPALSGANRIGPALWSGNSGRFRSDLDLEILRDYLQYNRRHGDELFDLPTPFRPEFQHMLRRLLMEEGNAHDMGRYALARRVNVHVRLLAGRGRLMRIPTFANRADWPMGW